VTVLVKYTTETTREYDASGVETRTLEGVVDQTEQLVLIPKGPSWSMLDYYYVA
jgi:hypothetical protein